MLTVKLVFGVSGVIYCVHSCEIDYCVIFEWSWWLSSEEEEVIKGIEYIRD